MNDLLDRIAATTPPDRTILLVCAAVALAALLLREVSALTRHLVTLMHEGGHAFIAIAAGRSLHGIRLHSDASGVSVSRGRPSGAGMVATLFAGYVTPGLVGLAGAYAVPNGWSNAYLWGVVLLCAAILLQIRNLHGLWVVLAFGVGLGLITWFGTDLVRSTVAGTLAWFLLLSGPWGMVGLWKARRRDRSRTDVDQLAAITPVPAVIWWTLMLLVTVATGVVGGLRLTA